jgi:hypothetical protein
MPRPEPDVLTGILQMDTDTSENLAGFVNFNQQAAVEIDPERPIVRFTAGWARGGGVKGIARRCVSKHWKWKLL